LLCWVGVHCGIYKGTYNVSITHTWIHPLHHSPLSSLPHPDSWNSFNRYHFCIYMHVYTFFVLYSPSYLLSLLPPTFSHFQLVPPYTLGRTCSSLLFSDFVEEKREKIKKINIFVCLRLRLLHREFPCDISMYICIITPIDLSPLIFFILP
jgi:hypothetical protein